MFNPNLKILKQKELEIINKLNEKPNITAIPTVYKFERYDFSIKTEKNMYYGEIKIRESKVFKYKEWFIRADKVDFLLSVDDKPILLIYKFEGINKYFSIIISKENISKYRKVNVLVTQNEYDDEGKLRRQYEEYEWNYSIPKTDFTEFHLQ